MSLTFGTRDHAIEFPNSRPDLPPTLDGKVALTYRRDATFFSILKGKPLEDEEYMDCIKTKDGKTDVCYFRPS
ncbi:hypothetical protein K7W42_16960 [Deinococcus sp. HMF7604]|uniref:hypothetical protein n=1 Tax=Deinococcus betulae TaxID=2873312 RepID=UPI001CCEBC3B|nr:hypothetical protein [Deinococcus betulae]MBZ9752541.1 hypothetical protein [Deinococcus betulae]